MMTDQFVEYSACPICGATPSSVLVPSEQLAYEREFVIKHFQEAFIPNSPDYMYKDHIEFTHTYSAELVQCKNCDHITRNPRLSPIAALKEYSEDSYHPDWLEASYKPYCDLFLSDIQRLQYMIGEKATVLEIGSQVGGFLHAATSIGWEAIGVDIGKDMVNFARSKGHLVMEGTLDDAKFSIDLFDAVFVWNCFEMLPDPWGSLKEIFRIMRPGGFLFITIPNGSFIKVIQPLLRLRSIKPLQLMLLKTLAYDILAGFSFQFGYTKSSILYLLSKSKYNNILISNLHYVPVSSEIQLKSKAFIEKNKLLKDTYLLAQAVYYLSLQQKLVAPWIEVRCQKPLLDLSLY